jgi:hypothetical protein
MSRRQLRDQLRLALGGLIVGGFVGALGGAVVGTALGFYWGNPGHGLDGAVAGAVLTACVGAAAVFLLPPAGMSSPETLPTEEWSLRNGTNYGNARSKRVHGGGTT